jgi:hypothetical protein
VRFDHPFKLGHGEIRYRGHGNPAGDDENGVAAQELRGAL